MNFVLSPRGDDPRRLAALVVVGLHLVVATVLVAASLAQRPRAPWLLTVDLLEARPPRRDAGMPSPPPRPARPITAYAFVPDDGAYLLPSRGGSVIGSDARTDVVIGDARVSGSGEGQRSIHELAQAARVAFRSGTCRPDYPASSLRAGATGTTRLRFAVDERGRITGVRLLQSSGATLEHRRLDTVAAEALAHCPASAGMDERGRPVASTVDVAWVWSLD